MLFLDVQIVQLEYSDSTESVVYSRFFFTITKGEAELSLESGLKNPDIRIILDGKATKENCTHKNIKCQ